MKLINILLSFKKKRHVLEMVGRWQLEVRFQLEQARNFSGVASRGGDIYFRSSELVINVDVVGHRCRRRRRH